MSILYFLSDTAYDKLWRLAVRTNYIKSGAVYGRGLSEFLDALSESTFTDQRPEQYKQSDAIRRENKLTTYWDAGNNRISRRIDLADWAIENYCSIAVDFWIGIGLENSRSTKAFRSTTITVAKVLEAIGIGWLEPSELPATKHRLPPPSKRGVRTASL